jgi:dienelactone hydrolase
MRRALSLALAAALAGCGAAQAQKPPPSDAPLAKGCTRVARPFVGTLCTPPHDGGKHPAMILLGGSEGGDSLARVAARFAGHGYVTASVAYFRAPGLPKALIDVPVEIVGSALGALSHRDDVDATRIGIFGGSKGGEFAFLAASTYPQIKAVVAIVPSPVAYMGLDERSMPGGCSWSYRGKPLPCVAASDAANQALGREFALHRPLALKPFYDASRDADPAATKAAFFRLERIDGPVLCLSGADDLMWNSNAQCDLAMRYLEAARHPYADRAVAYPHAGHTFIGATHGPASAVTSIDFGGVTVAFGGTKEGDAAAAGAAWPVIWAFLAKRLGGS